MADPEIEYQFQETARGVWRTYRYENGQTFREYRSKIMIGPLPLVHMTFGRDPATNRRIIATGIIAVGRLSRGVLAVGQASAGLLAIGQAAFGLFFLGQLGIGLAGIGQAAIAVLFGLGQLVTGYVAIGQFGLGYYVLGQAGVGKYVWCVGRKDAEAVKFFTGILKWFTGT